MGLFDKGNVLLLGAGASVPFGLPTGLSLMDDAVGSLRREGEVLGTIATESPFGARLSFKAPIYYAWNCDGDTEKHIDPNLARIDLMKFADWLQSLTFDTIDDVIRHYPSNERLLKILIANEIIRSTYATDQIFPSPELSFRPALTNRILPESTGKTPVRRNWIHRLINLIMSELLSDPSGWAEEGEKVRIVTFNYDNLLENVLSLNWIPSDALARLSEITKQDATMWQNVIEIVHPHGVLESNTPFLNRRDYPRYLASQSHNIVVTSENIRVDSLIRSSRDRARELCTQAKNIYAIGFAFAKSNCQLLGLESRRTLEIKSSLTQTVHYINFDGGYGLRDRVDRIAFSDAQSPYFRRNIKEYRDEKGGELHIDQALMAGFLGEMPS